MVNVFVPFMWSELLVFCCAKLFPIKKQPTANQLSGEMYLKIHIISPEMLAVCE